jgi:hypothetical protein
MLLAATLLAALPLHAAAKTCGSANGADSGVPGDASLFVFYDGSCSSNNQAADGDDVKAFLDKGGSATFLGPKIDFSLTKNTFTPNDQNTLFKDLSATSSATGFTDGNGFANVKSVGDALQSWEFDPIPNSVLGKLGAKFLGFDGILFRGQFTDLGGGSLGNSDTASFTIKVNLSDGSSVVDTFSALKLKADDGVFGFDEIGALPKGLTVDSIDAFTDKAHAWDQVKQIDFSIGPGAGVAPEPRTWVMMLLGFMGTAYAYRRRAKARAALAQ